MKCARCGAEIKSGCMYCSVCGYEVRIVPDYNVLEEELLADILDQENHKKYTQAAERQRGNHVSGNGERAEKEGRAVKQEVNGKHPVKSHSQTEEKHKKKSRLTMIVGLASTGAVLACIAMFGVMSYNNKHSFTYQFNQGLAAEASGNYTGALDYLERAKKIEPDNLDVRFEMADVYLALEQENNAVAILREIIELDSSSKKAYKELITLYEEEGDYEAIFSLYETAESDGIRSLFSDYLVAEPQFSKKSGSYEGNLKISLTSVDQANIYYTLDGTSPKKYGKLYSEPIELKGEGEYEIQAVCENEKGFCSDVVANTYTIAYTAPDRPTLLPGSGTYEGEGQMITIQVPAGCNAYYIWNNGEDSSAWGRSEVLSHCTMYIEPIPMAPGNNILEVFTVSPNGKISKSVKGNYIYNQ